MRNQVDFLDAVFEDDRLRSITAACDTALNARSLDVDEMTVGLTTGPEHLGFWTEDPYPFFTRDAERFLTTEDTDLGAWKRSDPVTLERGGSPYCIMYPDEATRVGKRDWVLSCTSALGKLTQLPHKGGVYTGGVAPNPTKSGALIREICGYQNGQPAAGVTVYVAPEFENIDIYGWLPYLSPTGENGAQTGSARDNFLQVLFAINACVRDDETGTLRVENLPTDVTAELDDDRVYRDNAQVVDEKPVNAVTVLEHTWFPSGDAEELVTGEVTDGQVFVFSEPFTDYQATGFTIAESGANYVRASVAGGGTAENCVLTGVPYVDATREVTRIVSELGTGDVPYTERIEQATLVGKTAVNDVADRLAAYYACRKWINVDAIVEFEDVGDVVSIWDPFDEIMRTACIERISPLTVSGVMKGRISALVGYTPWQTVAFTDVRLELTGSGSWTVPAGVHYLTAVLIGGGDGGQGGENGAPGEANALVDYVNGASVDAGAGGAGGAFGAGGRGAKFLRVDLAVAPGQTIAYSCGAAGSAGAVGAQGAGGGAGGGGGATTFGGYSSANGARSASGYHDANGGVYALPGASGVAGGAGGKGGKSAAAIEDRVGGTGGDAGSWKGGSGGQGNNEWTYYLQIGGAGGGGAAIGHKGGSGGGPIVNYDEDSDTFTVLGGGGGAGADATAPANPTAFGCGGNGGNGGGGGGGTGALSLKAYGYYHLDYQPDQGRAGAGSKGAKGAPGGIILYYRQPVS